MCKPSLIGFAVKEASAYRAEGCEHMAIGQALGVAGSTTCTGDSCFAAGKERR